MISYNLFLFDLIYAIVSIIVGTIGTEYINRCILFISLRDSITLQWRHNDHDGVSNHQPHGSLLNRFFRHRSKKTLKLRVTGLCVGNSPGPMNSPHKEPVTRKCLHLMMSSWFTLIMNRHWQDFSINDSEITGEKFTWVDSAGNIHETSSSVTY